MGVQMVDINVGKGKAETHFRVHKAILCAKLPYFDKMLNSGFKEGTENRVNLPEDDPDSFDLLMVWVYNDTLPPLEWNKSISGFTKTSNWHAFNLYALADKLCLEILMDQIASSYISATLALDALPGPNYLGTIFQTLPGHTAFRKYAASCLHYILHGLPKSPELMSTWPVEKLNLIMVANPNLTMEYLQLVQQHPLDTPVPDPRLPPYCKFHRHAADAPCPVAARQSI
ncbi:uncharacterized protein LY89DRAFT_601881 [Mollisia scopiformis]|uniref:BTB domain-containing protein n=1 Tax=Mollisia scopiformis TaxID=149040 RepID=A0A132B450_MOLSC|nr:uncharacterized protein LY89DRAFT_601881 [Mollisia scopiformis]KUJ07195.1 hypothetical protein LY89DRAFT_601881 [Mollisia scopiformis]